MTLTRATSTSSAAAMFARILWICGASFGKLFREDEDGYTEVAG